MTTYGKQLPTVNQRQMLKQKVYTYANTDIGATTTGAEYNNALVFEINGTMYTKAAGPQAVVLDTASNFTDLAASEKCLVAFCVNSGGTLSTVQSAIVAASADDPDWPAIPDTVVCYGGVKIEVSASGTFVFGTEDLNDAEITDTYYNFAGLPPTGASAFDYTISG